MAKVLLLRSSMVKKPNSFSNGLADAFKDAYKKINSQDEWIDIDLNQIDIANETLNSNNFANFFEKSDKYIDQLKQVHKVVVACPMTNFNICATLKNYLDHILVANKTFSYKYSKKGDAIGLLQHLKIQLLTTQGAPLGWYIFGDHTANLKGTFEFMGATVFEPIIVDGTKIPANANKTVEQRIGEFKEEIESKATKFANAVAIDYSPVELK